MSIWSQSGCLVYHLYECGLVTSRQNLIETCKHNHESNDCFVFQFSLFVTWILLFLANFFQSCLCYEHDVLAVIAWFLEHQIPPSKEANSSGRLFKQCWRECESTQNIQLAKREKTQVCTGPVNLEYLCRIKEGLIIFAFQFLFHKYLTDLACI